MSLAEVFGVTGGGLVILLSLIQITPIKLNPLSWIAKHLGRALNGEVLKEVEKVGADLKETQRKLDEHIRTDDSRDADTRRQRILRFNMDLIKGEIPTHEYCVDMLVEIDIYMEYCRTHERTYINQRATLAIENIKRVISELEATNGFAKV